MSAEGAGAVGIGIGIKIAVGAAVVALVSVLGVVVGFTVMPLKQGDELRDAGRRLAGGLFCSFMLGPLLAFKTLDLFPGYVEMWRRLVGPGREEWAFLAAGAPFIAIAGVVGFWLVAATVRWFANRDGKDIGELIHDARKDLTP